MEKILLVEDNPDMLAVTRNTLKSGGYKVTAVTTTEDALDTIRQNLPDLVISDVQLPGLSGVKLCQILKGEPRTAHLPIILLTVMGKDVDKVSGLRTGADDYITKPYSSNELLARVEALLRRVKHGGVPAGEIYKLKDLTVNMAKREVLIGSKTIELRPKEYEILALLIDKKDRVVTRDQLTASIWKDEVIVVSTTLTVLVSGLRRKLGPYGGLIKTVMGGGYRLNENFKLK